MSRSASLDSVLLPGTRPRAAVRPLRAGSVADRRAAADGDIARWPLPARFVWQVLLPLLAFAIANLWLFGFDGDRWVAARLFAWEGGHWGLRDSMLTTTVIHAGGKHLSTLAWLAVAVCTAVSFRRPDRRGQPSLRRPLVCLALSVLASTLLVSWLKHVTRMDCPWDALPFGGAHPYFDLLDAHPPGVRASGCFPAGHASAGYAWIALYFFFSATRPAWRWAGFAIGLAAGLVFGVSQQLRGAHFLSHDVWTLAICWFVALGMHHATIRWSLARAARGAALRCIAQRQGTSR